MVRLIVATTLLFATVVLAYYTSQEEPQDTVKGYIPSIITVEELPPIREENE